MALLCDNYDNFIIDLVEDDVVYSNSNQCLPMMSDDKNIEICDLCFEKPKNGQIEPCGHTACYHCLSNESIKLCPFCRVFIKQKYILL